MLGRRRRQQEVPAGIAPSRRRGGVRPAGQVLEPAFQDLVPASRPQRLEPPLPVRLVAAQDMVVVAEPPRRQPPRAARCGRHRQDLPAEPEAQVADPATAEGWRCGTGQISSRFQGAPGPAAPPLAPAPAPQGESRTSVRDSGGLRTSAGAELITSAPPAQAPMSATGCASDRTSLRTSTGARSQPSGRRTTRAAEPRRTFAFKASHRFLCPRGLEHEKVVRFPRIGEIMQ